MLDLSLLPSVMWFAENSLKQFSIGILQTAREGVARNPPEPVAKLEAHYSDQEAGRKDSSDGFHCLSSGESSYTHLRQTGSYRMG